MISTTNSYSHRFVIKFALESTKRFQLLDPRFFGHQEAKKIIKLIHALISESGTIPSLDRCLIEINQMKIDIDLKELLNTYITNVYTFDLNTLDRQWVMSEFEEFVRDGRSKASVEDIVELRLQLDDELEPDKRAELYKELIRAGTSVETAAQFDMDARVSYGFSLDDYEEIDAIDQEQLPLIQMDVDESGKQFNAFNRYNFAMLIGNPGVGKTQLTDALMSQIINRDAPKLFWKLDKNLKSILKIDTENGNSKVKTAIDKIAARAGVDGRDVVACENITYISTGALSLKRINKTVVELIEEQNQIRVDSGKSLYDLIVIDDGSGALSDRDINDIKGSGQLINDLIKVTEKYHCAVIMTIHPNTDSPKGKARGHLGSEAQRWCDRVWQIVSLPNTPVSYMYMKGNQNFKVRDGAGVSEIREHAMRYDKDLNYFVEISVSEFEHWKQVSKECSDEKGADQLAKSERENDIINDTIINAMEDQDQIEFKDIVTAAKYALSISDRTSERKIQEFVSANKSRFSINKSGRSNVIRRLYPSKNVDLLESL